jgi:Glyoxalase-like domain
MATLDHIMVAHADLDTAIALVEEATGVRAAPGGRHPGQGTHNALASFGDGTYLELIAPDPGGEGPLGQQFAALDDLTVATWIARADTAEEVAARARSAGWEARIMALSRATPDGGLLEWRMVSVDGHGAGGVMPIFIDWGATPHPSATQPGGLTLASFAVSAPRPEDVRSAFAAMGLDVEVGSGDESFRAHISGPGGNLDLTGRPMVRVD